MQKGISLAPSGVAVPAVGTSRVYLQVHSPTDVLAAGLWVAPLQKLRTLALVAWQQWLRRRARMSSMR